MGPALLFFFWGELPTEVVMPGLVPGIHVLWTLPQGVDGRDKPGHDDGESSVPQKLLTCER
ncbi:hypothetical protein M2232_007860 [Bradyrhizobium japonicum]|nr:hypothetical protein [Bradyrhizobium japonicum]MCW2339570.1 hypothetical protein [Bradyrhizobium japonicum]